METRTADLKWGIQATEQCPNEDVSDYSYTEDGFIHTIPGAEHLSAYKEEAAGFERVDSPMDSSYYTETTKKSQIHEKEGPAYVEVGFDEVFQLASTEE